MKRRIDPVVCGFLATAASAVNLVCWRLATHPADPLDLGALARLGPEAAPWLILSLVADGAFYLLLIPVACGLGGSVARRAGVVYAVLGATGAGLLLWSTVLSPRPPEQVERILHVVYFGLWNGVGAVAAALWWGAVAWRTRHTHRLFAAFTLVLSMASLMVVGLFQVGLPEAGGGVLVVLLGVLLVWPSAAALGPLRRRQVREGMG